MEGSASVQQNLFNQSSLTELLTEACQAALHAESSNPALYVALRLQGAGAETSVPRAHDFKSDVALASFGEAIKAAFDAVRTRARSAQATHEPVIEFAASLQDIAQKADDGAEPNASFDPEPMSEVLMRDADVRDRPDVGS